MGLKEITDVRAVHQAMEKFDAVGREAFLKEHGFGPAKEWFLVHEGNRYDSKAIWGVAYYFQHGERLRSKSFRGGVWEVVGPLVSLGFECARLSESGELVPSSADPSEVDEDEREATEGRVLYRTQRCYERDRRLVRRKRAQVLATTGRLACEICGFDSETACGLPGVIDVHHIEPLNERGEGKTLLSDLAVVCPTCHRLLHARKPAMIPEELRQIRASHVG